MDMSKLQNHQQTLRNADNGRKCNSTLETSKCLSPYWNNYDNRNFCSFQIFPCYCNQPNADCDVV